MWCMLRWCSAGLQAGMVSVRLYQLSCYHAPVTSRFLNLVMAWPVYLGLGCAVLKTCCFVISYRPSVAISRFGGTGISVPFRVGLCQACLYQQMRGSAVKAARQFEQDHILIQHCSGGDHWPSRHGSWFQVLGRADGLPLSFNLLGAGTVQ